MSGATAKATRRELRRAVGDEATGVINACVQAIDNQILPNLGALQTLTHNHENRIRLLDAGALSLGSALNHQADTQRDLTGELAAFRGMTLRQRLRWLIIGR